MTETERRALKQKLAWAEHNGYAGDELVQFMGVKPAILAELRRELVGEDTTDWATRYQQRRIAVQRLVWMVTKKGMTQGEVGDLLGMQQGEVSDIIKEWEKRPNTPTPSIQRLIGYASRELEAPPDEDLPDPSEYVPRRGRRPAPKLAPVSAPDPAQYNSIIRALAFGAGSMSEEDDDGS